MSLTMNSLPLSASVKEATGALHAEVEGILLPRLSSIKTSTDYATILKMFYGFYLPLEKRIDLQLSSADLPDLNQRRKAELILDDLSALGESSNNISICHQLPVVNNSAQAFGVLYVLEGSTLGGKVIAKMLLKNSSITEDAVSFFQGYKEDTGNRWKAFLLALNEQDETNTIMQSANDTFFYLKSWMQQVFHS